MSIFYYTQNNPDWTNHTDIEVGKWNIEFSQIWKMISTLSCRVYELVDTGFHIAPDLSSIETLRWKWEKNTRDLLKDTHNTFWLLMRWLSIATNYLRQWKRASVDLYKEDIRHRNFIDEICSATDGGKYAELLTLEIRSDEYGSLNNTAINKLQEATCTLWVGIGIEDFHEKANWDIDIDSTTRIIRGRIKPKFIKISSAVMERLRNNTVTTRVAHLYNWLKRMWVQIIEYIWQNKKTEDATQIMKNKEIADTLIKNARAIHEPMLTLGWEVWAEELLVRFDKWLWTDIWLNQLKELWHTQDLMIKMLSVAVEKAKVGKRISVNLYIKDVCSETLLREIKHITQYLPQQYRKNIIFELLEEKYGTINEKFIKHVHALQADGFSIAIDDLYISDKNTWLSIEILDELLNAGIYPDSIKLDGKHCMAIWDDTISTDELDKIRTLIWQFALMKPITITLEWIQDMEHAKKVSAIFSGIPEITLVFQWIKINPWNFGERENG